MRVNIWYKSCLFLIGLLIIFFTFFFKLKTGSFLKIGDEALKEVVKYEIDVRRYDLTSTSLSKSCVNLDLLMKKIKNDLKQLKNNSCVSTIEEKIGLLPSDSALLLIMHKIHDYAIFNKKKLLSNGLINYIIVENQNFCNDTLKIHLVFKENEALISEIENFPQFVECICKQP